MASLGLNPDSGFSAAQWYSLLGALDRWTVDALGEVDEPYALLVVGGAAISMQWNPRRLTHDVDVVSEGLPPLCGRVLQRSPPALRVSALIG